MTKPKSNIVRASFMPRVFIDVVKFHIWRREYNRTAKVRIPCDIGNGDIVTDTGRRRTDAQDMTWARCAWGNDIEAWLPVQFFVHELDIKRTDLMVEKLLEHSVTKHLNALMVETDEDADTARHLAAGLGIMLKEVRVRPVHARAEVSA